jgi:hypothetical protein
MMNTIAAVLFLFATASNPFFNSYEAVRQALIKGNVAGVQKAATAFAATARSANQDVVAAKASVLARAGDLPSARKAFAALSDEVIKLRASGDNVVVAYCPMEKKSWLQPKGEISNPYVDAGMRACGELKK